MPRQRDARHASGPCGEALLEMALEQLTPGAGHARRAQTRLERVIDAGSASGAGLFSGLAGLGWSIEVLAADPESSEEDDLNAAIDEDLLGFLQGAPGQSPYDLISGDVGIGVYGLARRHRSSGRALVARVIERLAETAQRDAHGVFWWSDGDWLPPVVRGEREGKYVDLGVSHGVPGVVGMLGRAVKQGLGGDPARELLVGACAWVLAQELPPNGLNAFSSNVGPRLPLTPTRTAWCYGDAGIAGTLWIAADALSDGALRDHAVRLATVAAARPIENCLVIDPAICHGSVGLAHIFQRFFAVTGERAFRDAAKRWLSHALSERKRGKGVAGFSSGDAFNRASKTDTSLLTGTAGIGLVLASELSNELLPWDEIFLVP